VNDTTANLKKDTNEIIISGPTIIAYFAMAKIDFEKDTNNEVNEVLSDFQEYQMRTEYFLEKNGIQLITIFKDTIKYRNNIIAEIKTPRTEKVSLGYIFITINKKPDIHYGVMTDLDILSNAEIYFGMDSLMSKYKLTIKEIKDTK
jgi:hypothetical protein